VNIPVSFCFIEKNGTNTIRGEGYWHCYVATPSLRWEGQVDDASFIHIINIDNYSKRYKLMARKTNIVIC